MVGLTLSTEQKAWAEEKIAETGLSAQIEIRLQDYRDTAEQFDAVASVEMVEAVGQRWWGAYLDSIARNLKRAAERRCSSSRSITGLFDPMRAAPISSRPTSFPAGSCSTNRASRSWRASTRLTWEDREAFRLDYAETLKRWRGRYNLAVASGELDGFGGAFHNLWRYYLMYCEGGFRGGSIDVAQVTMVKSH